MPEFQNHPAAMPVRQSASLMVLLALCGGWWSWLATTGNLTPLLAAGCVAGFVFSLVLLLLGWLPGMGQIVVAERISWAGGIAAVFGALAWNEVQPGPVVKTLFVCLVLMVGGVFYDRIFRTNGI